MNLTHTQFENYAATVKHEQSSTWEQLAAKLTNPETYPSKEACPWIKMAIFGDVKTDKGSVRHDANVLAINGVEGDYDGEQVSMEQAAAILRLLGVAAILYSSPSHSPAKPRWRVICPTSKTMPPEARYGLLASLDAVLGNILSGESYTLSQSYYFGRVAGGEFESTVVDGVPIDLANLPEAERKPKGKASPVGNWQPLPADIDAVLAMKPCPTVDDKEGYKEQWIPTVLGTLNSFGPAAVPALVRWSMTWYVEKYPDRTAKKIKATATADIGGRVQPEGVGKASWENVREVRGLPRVDVSRAFGEANEDWPWEEPVDIFDESVTVPEYVPGMLPAIYERFMETNFRFHNLASREPYAGLFDLAVAVHLRPSVRVEETPGAGKTGGFMHSLNEQAAIVGGTTRGKTKTMFCALGSEEGEKLDKWQKLEQARLLQVREVKENELRQKHKGDDRQLRQELEELHRTMPPPVIIHSKFTDKIMVRWCDTNGKMDLPVDDIVDEWENVFGGAAYRSDGGSAMTDLWRKAFDNMPYSDESMSSGRLESGRLSANLGYNCTGADMSAWHDYERALRNGTMARQSLYAPGKVWDGERAPIDWMAVQAWREIQGKLQTLQGLNLYLEEDREFDRAINEEIGIYSSMVDNGHYVEAWLAKSRIRVARCAARRFLVDELAAGRKPEAEAVIPRRYRREAWTFLTQFAWPHQCFVHKTLITGEGYRPALHALMRRAYVNWDKKQVFNRDELTNTKRPKSVKNGDDEFIKVLLNGYKWIRPKVTRIAFDRRQPWTAGSFEINPKLIEIGRKYHDRMHREHEINLGIIRKMAEC